MDAGVCDEVFAIDTSSPASLPIQVKTKRWPASGLGVELARGNDDFIPDPGDAVEIDHVRAPPGWMWLWASQSPAPLYHRWSA